VAGGTLRDSRGRAEEVPGQDAIRSRAIRSSRSAPWRCCAAISRRAGAVIKHSAATAKLLQHTGRAVVFENVEDMAARIDDPDLDVAADDVLVLRNTGPVGAPGMPEAGYLPIPASSPARA
jgi:dihydroxy-acid dehydratase